MKKLPAFVLAISLHATWTWALPMYQVVDLGAPSGVISEGISLNDNGDVVGFYLKENVGQHAFKYSTGVFTPLGTLGGTTSVALGINNNGQIVGGAQTAGDAEYHAYVYEAGSFHDLGTLGGTLSEAWSINNTGQIVGRSTISPAGQHSFLYQQGQITDLGAFGGDESQARGINSSGVITGWSETGANPIVIERAFISDGNNVIDPGTLGTHQRNQAWAINDYGMIVGSSSLSSSGLFHAFWFDGAKIIDIGAAYADDSSEAYGINNENQIVGWLKGANDEKHHAFLYQDGLLTDLNELINPTSGWFVEQARDINESGWIAASASHQGSSTTRAVLLIPISEPVPEPSVLALLGIWIVWIFFSRTSLLAIPEKG